MLQTFFVESICVDPEVIAANIVVSGTLGAIMKQKVACESEAPLQVWVHLIFLNSIAFNAGSHESGPLRTTYMESCVAHGHSFLLFPPTFPLPP